MSTTIWVWLKIKQEGLGRFWSMFPLTRVPFWHRFFEAPPFVARSGAGGLPVHRGARLRLRDPRRGARPGAGHGGGVAGGDARQDPHLRQAGVGRVERVGRVGGLGGWGVGGLGGWAGWVKNVDK